MSMWKGNADGQNGDTLEPEVPRDDGASGRASRRSYEASRRSVDEPTERTRLLDRPMPPPNADGYLNPDDPAVGYLI